MCINLLQSTDAITFSMIDLIVTLCSQKKGWYYMRVVSFLVQQLKLCKVEGSEKDTSPSSNISHILELVLSEDISTREIGVENELVGVTLDLLTNFMRNNLTGEKVAILKWVTFLLLILDHMLQCKIQLSPDVQNTVDMG